MQRFWASIEGSLAPGVRFYLTVLLTIAAANSLFILVSDLCSSLLAATQFVLCLLKNTALAFLMGILACMCCYTVSALSNTGGRHGLCDN